MEKLLKIKSNLDKLNSQALDDWNSLENYVEHIISNVTNKFISIEDAKTEIITLFRAYLDAGKFSK